MSFDSLNPTYPDPPTWDEWQSRWAREVASLNARPGQAGRDRRNQEYRDSGVEIDPNRYHPYSEWEYEYADWIEGVLAKW